MKYRREGLALWVGAGAFLLGSLALADGGPRVLLIGRSEKDATVTRIRQELRILGLEVDFVAAKPSRGDLASRAREHGATAAAEVQVDPPAIVLWTDPVRFPDVGGGPEVRVDEGLAGTVEPGLLALRAVELLHGRILPVASSAGSPADGGTPDDATATDLDAPAPPVPAATAAPSQAPSRPPAPPRAASAERASVFSAFAGPAILLSSGIAPTTHVWIGARVGLTSRFDLELTGAVPTTAATVSGVTGTVDARIGTVGAAGNLRFTGETSPLFASAGLGFGALFSIVGGEVSGASHSALGDRLAALPYLRASTGYWFANHLALRGDATFGAALPPPVVQVKGQEIASFGMPTATFGLAVEVRP